MSVTSAFTLPAQPDNGRVEEVPLGGDGWTSPRSFYAVEETLVHDAGGGSATVTCTLDQRYTSLVSFIVVTVLSAGSSPTATQIGVFQTGDDLWAVVENAIVFGGLAIAQVRPPGMLLVHKPGAVPFVQIINVNVDTESTKLNMRVYNFNREMIRNVPISLAMLAIPR